MSNEQKLRDYLKRVTTDLHQTRERLRQVEDRANDPIVIVGAGCRFPGGVGSPEGLWGLVADGVDAIAGFPGDRGWNAEELFDPDPAAAGHSYAREGGFLDDLAGFDAEFFGVSPREVLAVDPQQRVLLEVAWEALEQAGIDPLSLRGSDTGVFAGIIHSDYGARIQVAPEELEGYFVTGNSGSVASGRVAYVLGLEGPAVSVDTACSSSLVSLHLAVQSLRSGECSLALAGGVTAMATPYMFVEFSRQRGLAPDGRCKPFAQAADGTGWGEGAGFVVLERLSDARRLGHEVWAVVRGSAVNQDGASSQLSAPNGPSQQRVIRAALASAGLGPGDVDAVEAHGTGTRLGDPIEAQALIATYGQGRSEDQPLWLGSLKSNIGHTQAAAGVGGVIKMVMAMRHGVLPKTLHVDEPSSYVDWSAGSVRLLTEAQPWPETGRPARAAVSSFGISGTNAHIILEAAPLEEQPAEVESNGNESNSDVPAGESHAGPVALTVSGGSQAGLRAQAARLGKWLDQQSEPVSVSDVAFALAGRSVLPHRAVLLADGPVSLRQALEQLATGQESPNVVVGQAGEPGRTVFVFPGQGSQWAGMGVALLDSNEVFARRMAECEAALLPYTGWSPIQVLRDGPEGSDWSRAEIIQPVLFSVMVSLAAVWESLGIAPAAVVGHSQGEIAAACVAGALSLSEAARVVALRSQALHVLAGKGGMASIGLPVADVRELLVGTELSVAAVNGPGTTVISGRPDQLAAVVEDCKAREIRARMIEVDYASHGSHVEAVRDRILEDLAGLTPEPSRVVFYSTVTGEPQDTAELDAAYWYRNLRQTVEFEATLRRLLDDGYHTFIEISPHPVLTLPVQQTAEDADTGELIVLHTLHRERGDWSGMLHAAARAHTHGLPVTWPEPDHEHRVILPTYAFQHQRYWLDAPALQTNLGQHGLSPNHHPVLTVSTQLSDHSHLFLGRLTSDAQPWTADHAVAGTTILPGTGHLDLVLAAADQVGADEVRELVIEAPLIIPADSGVDVHVRVDAADESGQWPVTVYSREPGATGEDGWVRHASGRLAAAGAAEPAGWTGAWPPAGAAPIDLTGLYEDLAESGYDYGTVFRGLCSAWSAADALYAEVCLPEDIDVKGFGVHPALLDAVLHALLAARRADGAVELELPFSWSGVRLHATGATELRAALYRTGDEVAIEVTDPSGAPVASVAGLTVRSVAAADLAASVTAGRPAYTVAWLPVTGEPSPLPADGVAISADSLPGVAATYLDLEELTEALDTGAPAPSFAVLAWSGGPKRADLPATVAENTAALLDLARQWLAEPRLDQTRLIVATRGALAAGAEDEVDLALAPAWGLIRSAQNEHPGRFILVDLDTAPLSEQVLAAALASDSGQLAVRGETLLAPRLSRAAASVPAEGPVFGTGTVLITGATGALGRLLARHLVTHHGVVDLLLTSRGGLAGPSVAELVDELTALGARPQVAACDMADRRQVTALLAAIPADRPLTGVVHAAGVLDDGLLAAMTQDQLDRVLRPKVDAAWLLHELTASADLSAFVLYSSAAGVLGTPGQANYAAANTFLDALAQHRRRNGQPAVSIAWGLWAEASDLTRKVAGANLARLRRAGIRPLSAADGLAMFDAAVARDAAVTVCADIDVPSLTADTWSALLRTLARPRRREAAQGAGAGGGIAARLAGVGAEERERLLQELVRQRVGAVLGFDSPDQLALRRPFSEFGMDSLSAVEVRNRLRAETGLPLATTAIFDYPNIGALAKHLSEQLFGGAQNHALPAVRTAAAQDDPIVVVGVGCRYPGGVESPEGLWSLVSNGVDAVSGFPTDRGWDLEELFDPDPAAVGHSYTREGGFLDDVAGFDAQFFGVSPREALAVDPQQRVLLEVAWEALERAGIDPLSLRGSDTGVFAGIMYSDYASRLQVIPEEFEGYIGTGSAGSVASGRIAYVLGLEGPAMSVDTACSSSLVSLHLAVQALRAGECSLALAGGVTALATPTTFVEFSRQRGLAADGRCKSFAQAADGTGWGEGAGLLVLERLSDAQRLGHEVWAVVRGSAVNQDGASSQMSAPNGPSQQRVIRAALASAGLGPSDVDAVEAHGTGTRLGDPIEAQALIATYGQGRSEDQPLWLGSLKSNIGHTQAAAGVGGVIKMVMAMRHGVLPQTLHVDEPSSFVDWSAGSVQLLTESRPWPQTGRPARAAVSSFGISGTNAHVILEAAPSAARTPAEDHDGPAAFVVSGSSQAGLRAQAARLGEWLDHQPEPVSVSDVALALAGRSALPYRAAVVAEDQAGLRRGLSALAAGQDTPGLVTGQAGEPGRAVFVFPGQGSQWAGMGVALLDSNEVFARRMAECEAALLPYTGWSLTQVLREGPGNGDWERAEIIQPLLFAMMVSLAAVWESLGIAPAAVVGHSQGEIAAACVAGALSLSEAARVVALRSQALHVLAGKGGMASIGLPVSDVRELLVGTELSVAAVNGPGTTVISGWPDQLATVVEDCKARDIRARVIAVDYASHGSHVEAVRDRILEDLAGLAPESGHAAFYSTVTAEPQDTTELDEEYWYRNLRQTVQLHATVQRLLADGYHTFIEVSPHPVLTPSLQETADDAYTGELVLLHTLHRDRGDWSGMLQAAAQAHTRGLPVTWPAPGRAGRVDLPTYAFQHQRYWLDAPVAQTNPGHYGLATTHHPILTANTQLPDDSHLFMGRLTTDAQPWTVDHTVSTTTILPATAHLDLTFTAAGRFGCDQVDELTIEAPLVLDQARGTQIQVSVDAPDESGRRRLAVYSRPAESEDGGWVRHVSATVSAAAGQQPADEVWPAELPEPVDLTGVYQRLAEAGYDYGPAFRGLTGAWSSGKVIYAEVALPEEVDTGGFLVHPALLDAVLHPLVLAAVEEDPGPIQLPFSWTGVRLRTDAHRRLRARIERLGSSAIAMVVSDLEGQVVLTVDSLTMRQASLEQLRAGAAPRSLFQLTWADVELSEPVAGNWALLGEDRWALLDTLADSGVAVTRHSGLDSVGAMLDAGLPAPDVLLVCAADTGAGTAADTDSDAGIRGLLASTLDTVQRVLADERLEDTRVLVATSGAVGALPRGGAADLAGAAVWGLIRSAQNEHPGRFTLVDLDAAPASRALLAASADPQEPQLVLRDGAAAAPRLRGYDASQDLVVPEGDAPWRLDSTAKGLLDNLALIRSEADAPLGELEVRIAVRAAGLNFRDVINALGVVDQDRMGNEGAGVVLEVGAGVTGLAPGDRVMGLFGAAFGPVAIADHRMLAPIPDGWTYAMAAAVPVCYLTAYYGLVDLGGLRPGENALVHAATGGVGIAATQIARHLGARVCGTAGPGKWDVLRSLGYAEDRIASSRDLDFEDKFRATTAGRGIDVVLNSLAGDYVDASARLLARGGRLIEMGKTDIRRPEEFAAAYGGARYRAFVLADAGPDRIKEMFAEVLDLFAQGALQPLPLSVWDVRQAREAFRHMSLARHIGKIVLTMPPRSGSAGTALITGASGVLAGAVARHLATEHGYTGMVLVSRRGADSAQCRELAAELTGLGVAVTIEACDAADRTAMAAVLGAIPADRPLTTVVHAAGVLDDAAVNSMTVEQLDRVLRPKTDAALVLDELTRPYDLAAFVLFSSAAGVFGSPGQAAYAAANSALDALAARRRNTGLPAVSVDWGLWHQRSEMTAELDTAALDRMRRSGVTAMSTAEGLGLFDWALRSTVPAVLAARIDEGALAEDRLLPPVLRGLRRRAAGRPRTADQAVAPAQPLEQQLAGLSREEAVDLVLNVVRVAVAAVLGHASPDEVPAARPFKVLGIDSLTAVEVRNRIAEAAGVRLPATLVFDHPTPAAVAVYLVDRLVTPEPDPVSRVLDGLEQLVAALPHQAESVTTRLRDLLWKVAKPVAKPAEDLDGASDDELFEALDSEFEMS